MVPSHVLYDSYGPPCLIWNRYLIVSSYLIWTGIIWSPHMWSVFMSYMTLMVPHTLYGVGIIWSPTCTIWLMVPPYLIWNMYLMVPPYLIWNGYHSPPHVYMVPQMWSVFMSYNDSYGPPYFIWNRYCMVPHWYVCPHIYMYRPHHMYMITVHCMNLVTVNDSYGPPYLIWNKYLMVPLTLYGIGIVWSPHMYDMIFSGQLRKRSTACPNNGTTSIFSGD